MSDNKKFINPLKHAVKLTDHCYVFKGAVNTGILIMNHEALLFDCCDSLQEEDLKKLGVEKVSRILFTQHRRTHTAGAYQFIERGTEFVVPYEEKQLFVCTENYWGDLKNRWHLYHHQPGPQVMTISLPAVAAVHEEDVIDWEGYRIEVYDTPGATDGSISYVFNDNGKKICFSGDVIYGCGQLPDLYSLQKGITTLDYHGFIGNMKKLVPSMRKLQTLDINVLVPSHGDFIYNPSTSFDMAIENMDALLDNYCSISSMNYYFPNYFEETVNNCEKLDL
ncbi:MAG: MBL fold metallo-hydrolase, partial [Clostridiales bacterium]|nr:MBL fold metallo-hydrolase [Clostridiales bacterium]